MIPERENLQEAKSVCPAKPRRHYAIPATLRRFDNVGFLVIRIIFLDADKENSKRCDVCLCFLQHPLRLTLPG